MESLEEIADWGIGPLILEKKIKKLPKKIGLSGTRLGKESDPYRNR